MAFVNDIRLADTVFVKCTYIWSSAPNTAEKCSLELPSRGYLRLSFAKVGAAFEAQLGEMEGRGRPGASANPLPAQTFGIGNG